MSGRESLSHVNCLIFQFASLSHKIREFSESRRFLLLKHGTVLKHSFSVNFLIFYSHIANSHFQDHLEKVFLCKDGTLRKVFSVPWSTNDGKNYN